MHIATITQGQTLVVTVTGRLDATSAPEFQSTMVTLIESGNRRFALDLAGLIYISSAGLKALLIVAKQLAPLGGKIVLCRPTDHVTDVLRISAFNTLFDITPDLAAE